MNKVKIVIADYKETLNRDLKMEENILKEMLPGCQVVFFEYEDTKLSHERFLEEIADADAIKTAFVKLDKDVLAHAPLCKCVSFGSTGYNNIDLNYARKNKILVSAVKEYCTYEVADHCMLLIMALNKKLKEYDKMTAIDKKWIFNLPTPVHSLNGMTLGLIGYGKIAKAVAVRAKVFGMKVIVKSNHLSEDMAKADGVEKVSMECICEKSDVISIHCNLTSNNKGMINQKFFDRLKRKPVFINVGRGGLVDEAALINAVNCGLVSAVGLDVLESESPDLSKFELAGRDNVIITPHAAFYSVEALKRLHTISTENIAHMLLGNTNDVWLV